ncbi:TetR/AcrR family transcriptional regulator [Ancylobacter sp. 6x-1]|uniref:TetR/AcrR family transcriptional regulator n=1 Tax=Ancylobacter crimeensis TaxID=2579147 RepID=A0ABT0DDT7_9HYPH|nr:TetR/AcrR family transcriptional regulator [Ancylobacter crimeensis]MCK0198130.1 TetR/AcrR family transcriptional regulator [Ancylobacter crimeensis]
MPRIVDHDERRRQICDALLDVTAEVGVASATIRGVAERSGWSTGVIGHFFKNRKDLLLGGLRRAAEIHSEHNTRMLSTLEGLQALESILEGAMPLDRRRLAMCRIFFFFYAEAMCDEQLRLEIESYLVGWRRSVARAIRQAQEKGDLQPHLDARSISADLIGLVEGLATHAMLDPSALARLQEFSPIRFWVRRLALPSEAARDDAISDPVHQVVA